MQCAPHSACSHQPAMVKPSPSLQDIVSLGTHAALTALDVCRLLKSAVAIHLLAAAQVGRRHGGRWAGFCCAGGVGCGGAERGGARWPTAVKLGAVRQGGMGRVGQGCSGRAKLETVERDAGCLARSVEPCCAASVHSEGAWLGAGPPVPKFSATVAPATACLPVLCAFAPCPTTPPQAVELRQGREKLGAGSAPLFAAIRRISQFVEADRPLDGDVAALVAAIESRELPVLAVALEGMEGSPVLGAGQQLSS